MAAIYFLNVTFAPKHFGLQLGSQRTEGVTWILIGLFAVPTADMAADHLRGYHTIAAECTKVCKFVNPRPKYHTLSFILRTEVRSCARYLWHLRKPASLYAWICWRNGRLWFHVVGTSVKNRISNADFVFVPRWDQAVLSGVRPVLVDVHQRTSETRLQQRLLSVPQLPWKHTWSSGYSTAPDIMLSWGIVVYLLTDLQSSCGSHHLQRGDDTSQFSCMSRKNSPISDTIFWSKIVLLVL